jgi:hypothetical protein
MIDLAQFVSDYLAIESDTPATARDIAEAYVETSLEHDVTDEELETLVDIATKQVAYYL